MNPFLREMTAADIDAVLHIEQQVHGYPWTRGNFCDALGSNNICKVYTESDAILGYAIFMPSVDEVELLDIGIAAEFQRKGLGRRLLFEIMDGARSMNMRRMLLEVRASNVAARGLYDAAGFREIGLRRGYYPADNGREDAVLMEYLL